MTFIADLAAYDYHPGAPVGLAVGWLDASTPFTSGTCPDDVRDRLVDLAARPVRVMRGQHHCPYCTGDAVARGSGEVWVTGPDGTAYGAPALIAHYVSDHGYLPPPAFLEAVRAGGPTPGAEARP